LASLLQACYKSFGMNSSDAKKIAEKLYLEHELITYPRRDNSYLYDESYTTGLERISFTDQFLSTDWANSICVDYKSPAFNESKCGAHTGIIPTMKNPENSNLNDNERKVYELIALRFAAQFMGPSISDKTNLILTVEKCEHDFVASGVIKKSLGFEIITGSKKDSLLPDLKEGDKISIDEMSLIEKITTPPAYFNEDTIISAMVNIASFVEDKNTKALLKEAQGIGTPATQTEIIATLAKRNYIDRDKKIRPTKLGLEFYDSLLPELKNIGMTGVWEGMLKGIRDGTNNEKEIKSSVIGMTKSVVSKSSSIDIKVSKIVHDHNCPKCKSGLVRRKGASGFFWGCLGYKDGCKYSCPDKKGKPDLNPTLYKCPSCSNNLTRRKGGNDFFWGCLGYKDGCKYSCPDLKGKPTLTIKDKSPAAKKQTCGKCNESIVRRYSSAKDFHFWVHEIKEHGCKNFIKDIDGKPE
jgi:DNA topoisomerase-3